MHHAVTGDQVVSMLFDRSMRSMRWWQLPNSTCPKFECLAGRQRAIEEMLALDDDPSNKE